MSEARPLPHAGDVIADRYVLQSPLGEGGMGAVYKALDKAVGETIALKILTSVVDEQDVERFRREVRLSRRITHANVARVFDLGEQDGVLFLTMEYIDGETLDAYLNRGLTARHAAEIARDVARALSAAHAIGTVHRDLKPSNILISREGRVVLTDFGIAIDRKGPTITQRGLAIGTPAYMAPEQLTAQPLNARADLYSLGLLMHEMLTGRLPFSDRPNVMLMAMARSAEDPPDPRTVADMPEALAELITHCLKKDVDARVESAASIADALSEWLDATQTSDFGPRLATSATAAVTQMRTAPAFAPLVDVGPTLAVSPFRYRGPPDESYLGDGIAESVIDVLSSTVGMRVVAFAALESLGGTRGPAEIAERLHANAIVDGTVRRSGNTVRVDARLVEAPSGMQVWSDRFERSIDDMFALEETLSLRIAEALRVRVELGSHGGAADPKLVATYLRARQAQRAHNWIGETGSVKLFGDCLEMDPTFAPAIASRAIGTLRASWEDASNLERDWVKEAEEAVELAKKHAPELPETHLAIGMLANHKGDLGRAAWALARAVQLAPAHAEANYCLADIQCEAGRIDEGLKRLRLVLELDPTTYATRLVLARHSELLGDHETCDEQIRLARKEAGPTSPALVSTEIRIAAWRGDMEGGKRLVEAAKEVTGLVGQILIVIGQYLTGELEELHMPFDLINARSPRMQSLLHQVTAEAHCVRGNYEQAMQHVRAAADGSLFDVQWLKHCPVLEPLRERPAFTEIQRQVAQRADAVWRHAPLTTRPDPSV